MSASGAALRHQPMNWCDSIRVSDDPRGDAQGRSQSAKAHTALNEPMIENFI